MSERGNFIVYTNRDKQPGDNRPAFTGRVAAPGTEKEFTLALWAGKDKNGRMVFTGRTLAYAASSDAIEQLRDLVEADAPDQEALEEGGLKLEPMQIIMFQNSFKDAAHPDRPDFWGRWNPGHGQPLVAVSGWLRKDRYQRPMLAGQTSLPQPGVEAAKAEASVQTLEQLVNTGLVTTADKAKTKPRGASRSR